MPHQVSAIFKSFISRLKSRYRRSLYEKYFPVESPATATPEDIKERGFYSQCGQDAFVVEQVFREQSSGVFVDVGAHDGISISNTLKLEQLGWTGLAIEPIPEVYERLEANRNCITENCCIARHDGVVTFQKITGYSQMLSGVTQNYAGAHKDRIHRELKQHGGESTLIQCQSKRLDTLLREHNIRHINYLSIDVEGSEMAVLDSFDLDEFNVDLIGIENNYHDYRIPKFLVNKGYRAIAKVGDEFFVSTRFLTQAV